MIFYSPNKSDFYTEVTLVANRSTISKFFIIKMFYLIPNIHYWSNCLFPQDICNSQDAFLYHYHTWQTETLANLCLFRSSQLVKDLGIYQQLQVWNKKLVWMKCVCCPWALEQSVVSTIFGIIFLLLSGSHMFPTEGVVL